MPAETVQQSFTRSRPRPGGGSSFTIKAWKFRYLTFTTFFVLAGILYPINQIDLRDSALDGFVSQLLYIENNIGFLNDGILSQFNSHIVRWLIFWPMLHTNLNDYVFYLLYATPLLLRLFRQDLVLVALLIFVLPYAVSLRSALAGVGLLSVCCYLQNGRNILLLAVGVVLSVLSSATVIQSLLLISVFWSNQKSIKFRKVLPFLSFLAFFALISVIDKITGALLGAEGYSGSSNGSGVLLNYVTRGTVFVSIALGQTRMYFYLVIAFIGLGFAIRALIKRTEKAKISRRILICILPGFFFEGLGVIAAAPVIFWLSQIDSRQLQAFAKK